MCRDIEAAIRIARGEGVAKVEGRAFARVGGGQVGLAHVPDLTVAVLEVLADGPVM